MSTIETIVEDLRYLPKDRFAAAAEVIHKMREDYLAERNRIIDETAGSMSEAEAAVFQQALTESRRVDTIAGLDERNERCEESRFGRPEG